MKSFRLFIATMLLTAGVAQSAFAAPKEMTRNEEAACGKVKFELTLKKIECELEEDNTLSFTYNDQLFWISFKEIDKKILYTINRNYIRILKDNPGDEIDKESNDTYLENRAAFITDYINSNSRVKAYYKDGIIYLCLSAFYSSPESFSAAILGNLSLFNGIRSTYEKGKKYATERLDKISGKKPETKNDKDKDAVTKKDTRKDILVQPQPVEKEKPSNTSVQVTEFGISSHDAKGAVLTPLNSGLYQKKCEFLYPEVRLKANEDLTARICVRIINPDGKLLVPDKDAKYTFISAPLKIKKKAGDFQTLGKFGSEDSNFWKPGRYTIELYEETCPEKAIYTENFNVL